MTTVIRFEHAKCDSTLRWQSIIRLIIWYRIQLMELACNNNPIARDISSSRPPTNKSVLGHNLSAQSLLSQKILLRLTGVSSDWQNHGLPSPIAYVPSTIIITRQTTGAVPFALGPNTCPRHGHLSLPLNLKRERVQCLNQAKGTNLCCELTAQEQAGKHSSNGHYQWNAIDTAEKQESWPTATSRQGRLFPSLVEYNP